MHQSKEEIPVLMEGEGLRTNFHPARVGDLKTPTLILLGGDSPELEKAAAEDLDAALPDSRIAVMPGQAHVAQRTAPEVFVREVVQFLTQEQRQSASGTRGDELMTDTKTRNPQVKTATVEVNGAEIYHEVRGSGPPVLFIVGATGDGGAFERVARLLADEFTVITYDRRGNSRSPLPSGWDTTSPEEQADDAAALLDALGLAPTAVFGTSSGGVFALCLLVRHPEAVRGAILHEPGLFSVLARPEEVIEQTQQMVEEAMKRGGPRAAVEAFLRFGGGDENFENLDPEHRERMLGNGETLFGIEFGTFESYRPTDETLAEVEVPVQVASGTESPPFFGEAARWLADRLGVEIVTLTGGHMPYLSHPEEMAERIRPFLRQVSQPGQSDRAQAGRRRQ